MLTDTNPAGRYWIKLDGTDVKEALQHSVKDKWAGDVDVNDNKLQQLREEYESRVSFIKSCTSTADVDTAKEQLLVDLEAVQTFLDTAFKAASKELRKKFDKKNANCEILKALNWDVVECNSLLQECMNCIHKFSNNCEFCAVAKSVESDYQLYLKNFFKKKSIPVNPPPFRMDWVSCAGDINLPHTPFPPARSPPNKKIKYNKILTYILRSIFLEIPHLELPR